MDFFGNTTIFIYLIPLVTSLCIFLSYLKFKRLANPVTFISIWWGGWLWVTNLSLTGLFIPGTHTQLLIILMIVGYTCGALIANKTKERNNEVLQKINIDFNKKFSSILKIGYPVVFIFIVPLFIKSIFLFQSLSIVDLDNYRRLTFGVDEPSILYGSAQVTFLYSLFVYGFLFLLLIVSAIFLYFFENKIYLGFSLILFLFKSIMELGRTDIYGIFLLIVILSLLFNQQIADKIKLNLGAFKSRKNLWFFLVFLLITIVIGVSIISGVRKTENQGENIFGIFYDFAIWYHTSGFILLDTQVDNPSSILSQNITYGLSTFSGLEWILLLIINIFINKEFNGFLPMIVSGKERSVFELNVFMDDLKQVGPETFGNAYYTMVYNFYQDGRELGVFFISFILGFITSLFYQDWLKNKNFYSLTWLLLFLYMTFLSLFQYYFAVIPCITAAVLLCLVQNIRTHKLNN